MNRKDLHQRLIDKYGPVIDLRETPGFLYEVYRQMDLTPDAGPGGSGGSAEPFGVSWMDSWVAHWIYNQKLSSTKSRDTQVAAVLQGLVDLKFNERLVEIQGYISNARRLADEPPDGGPEPGAPPAGPESFRNQVREEFRKVSRIFRDEPPDGGTPEPGVPPAGPERIFLQDAPPDGGTPEPGVPPAGPEPPGSPEPPPEPGVPVPPFPGPIPGPEIAALGENPWILYWFLSIKAPLLLDVIDAHVTRRINALVGSERT